MGVSRLFIAALGLHLTTVCCAADLALTISDDPKPEKDEYWLLDPTPDSDLRSFSTDRPTKSDVPFTVDAGHFQYETDLVNFTHQQTGGFRTDTLLVPNPTLKVGLTNNADFELNIAAFANVQVFNPATGMTRDISATSDLFLRMKVNFWGNDGGNSAFALIPYVRLPTAPAVLGDQSVEGGVIAPLSFSLPNDFTLLFNAEVDALRDSADSNYHPNFIALANLSRSIIKDVTAYVEIWSDANSEPRSPTTQLSFDTALAWKIQPNLQADLGMNIGLNNSTPGIQVYVGLSQRF